MKRMAKRAAWRSEVSADAVVVGLRVDRDALRESVREALDAVLEDAHAVSRYTDRSYLDDDGNFHARGGIWNAGGSDGRASSGYTRQHVADAVRRLRECGIETDFDGADALLCQYEMAGEIAALAVAVRTSDGGKAFVELGCVRGLPREAPPFEICGMRFFPQPAGFVVSHPGETPRFIVVDGTKRTCSCMRDACEHLAALKRHEDGSRGAFDLPFSGDPRAKALREMLELGRRFGLGKPRERRARGQFRDDVAAAIWLILKCVYRSDLRTCRDVRAVVKSGIIGDVPSERSFYRYAAEENVLHVLRCMLTCIRERLLRVGFDIDSAVAKETDAAESIASFLGALVHAESPQAINAA